ncbi:MAG: orotidine-5'-phosphate decarboxylase [candidate division Zixibacteria bacterium]|nr:orotidine-5'-phosphate decarboxylase [candidate division Zixibacteria bacterium]
MMGCLEKLAARRRKTGAILCIGLDPDLEKMPAVVARGAEPLYHFSRLVVEATSRYACAFKPNLAFFEAYGSKGIAQLEKLLAEIPSEVPTILDGKRGDIGNTSRLYARFLFEHLNGDAATINPYLGQDSLEPFFDYPGKVAFVLCLTSNPGSADIQTLQTGGRAVYQGVIDHLRAFDGRYGLVVGAQHQEMLADVRQRAPNAPLLIPGVGAQGGELAGAVTQAATGGAPALINVSRDILYASSQSDFAEQAAARAEWYVAAMKPLLSP